MQGSLLLNTQTPQKMLTWLKTWLKILLARKRSISLWQSHYGCSCFFVVKVTIVKEPVKSRLLFVNLILYSHCKSWNHVNVLVILEFLALNHMSTKILSDSECPTLCQCVITFPYFKIRCLFLSITPSK